jgi:hypothetical protein
MSALVVIPVAAMRLVLLGTMVECFESKRTAAFFQHQRLADSIIIGMTMDPPSARWLRRSSRRGFELT